MSSEVTVSATDFAAFKADVDERFQNFVAQLALLSTSIESSTTTSSLSTEFAVLKADIDERFENLVAQLKVINNDVVAIQSTTSVTEFPDEEQQIREKWLSAFDDEVSSLLANISKINSDIIALQRLVGTIEIDHSTLSSLSGDDHPQYVLASGARAMSKLDVSTSGTFHGAVQATTFYGDGTNLTGIGSAADHGLLTGLNDDDHPLYSLANGTRPFTGTVGGVTPVAATDLTTKSYVDGLVVTDHGSLTGLSDDDHTQYLLADGTRSITNIVVNGSGYFTDDFYVDGSIHGVEKRVRFVMDNSGTELATGRVDAAISIPSLRLTEWSILAYPSGSIEMDILSGNTTNLPPATSITASNYPSVTNDNKASSTVLTGWTDTLPEDTVLDVNIVSCSGITKCFLDLYGVEL